MLGAYLIGAVPFSQVISLKFVGVDLRTVSTGTVSGTGLYGVGGRAPLIVGGLLDVAKGALAAALAGGNSTVAVFTAAAVVIGHCWSVFLRGAGGRGLSPAMGVLAVLYWPGALLLLAALAIGRSVAASTRAPVRHLHAPKVEFWSSASWTAWLISRSTRKRMAPRVTVISLLSRRFPAFLLRGLFELHLTFEGG